MVRGVKHGAAYLGAIGTVLFAWPAHAGGHGLSAVLWVEGDATVLPNTSSSSPSFSVTDVSTSGRASISGSTPPFRFPMGFVGLRAGMDFVAADRTVIPLLDVGVFGIVGQYSEVLTSVDGSFLSVSPSTMVLIDGEISGIGLRFKHRRWMFGAAIKPGVAFMVANGAVADGKGFTSIDSGLTAFSPTLRVDLQVCRRFDPIERACLVAQPNVYEWGWGNGGSLAIRYEFGP